MGLFYSFCSFCSLSVLLLRKKKRDQFFIVFRKVGKCAILILFSALILQVCSCISLVWFLRVQNSLIFGLISLRAVVVGGGFLYDFFRNSRLNNSFFPLYETFFMPNEIVVNVENSNVENFDIHIFVGSLVCLFINSFELLATFFFKALVVCITLLFHTVYFTKFFKPLLSIVVIRTNEF